MRANPAPPVAAISPASAAAVHYPSRSGETLTVPTFAPVPAATSHSQEDGRVMLRTSADAW